MRTQGIALGYDRLPLWGGRTCDRSGNGITTNAASRIYTTTANGTANGISTKGATYRSPGQRPGYMPKKNPKALKGRPNSGTTRIRNRTAESIIFASAELQENSVIRKFRITAADGKNYDTQHYNLDAIISVGYRVNSVRATQFRQWATSVLLDCPAPTVRPISAQGNALGYNHPRTKSPEWAT